MSNQQLVPHKQLPTPLFGSNIPGLVFPPICTSDGNIIVCAEDNLIYKLNTHSQKWSEHDWGGRYDRIDWGAACLSPDEKQFFIFDGRDDQFGHQVLIIINIETMEVIKVMKHTIKTGSNPSIICTKTNSNVLHVIGGEENKKHYTININNGQINTIYEFKNVLGPCMLYAGCIVYIENENKIIYIHPSISYIYSFNLKSNQWKNLNVKIPLAKDVCGCGYVLSNDNKYIIIMSGYDYGVHEEKKDLNEIYIYNTNTNDIKTYNMLSPIEGIVGATMTNNNMIHLFDGDGHGEHYKFSLNSIISIKNKSKEETVQQWLANTVQLPELYPLFKAQAVDDLEAVKILTKTDLKDMKIKIGHVNKLMPFIKQLNDKSTDEKDEKSNDDSEEEKEEEEEEENQVKQWLKNTVKLPKLYPLFATEGYDDLEDIKNITDTDLNEMGITKKGQVKKLMRFIEKLKD